MDFHPRGTVLATASDDHSVRIWDLRKRRRSGRDPPKKRLGVDMAVGSGFMNSSIVYSEILTNPLQINYNYDV